MINPITIFSKYFRHSKTSNGTVDKFHSVRRQKRPFAKWFSSGVFRWWLHDVFTAWSTRSSTWYNFTQGRQPGPSRQHSCDKLSFSWDDVEVELEAFYSPVAVELLSVLTLQKRWVFICFPLWQSERVASSRTYLQFFLVWNASHAITCRLKQLSKPPRFIFNLRASFLPLFRKWSCL